MYVNLSEQFCHPLPTETDHCALQEFTTSSKLKKPKDIFIYSVVKRNRHPLHTPFK